MAYIYEKLMTKTSCSFGLNTHGNNPMVGNTGLEPARTEANAPKTFVSAIPPIPHIKKNEKLLSATPRRRNWDFEAPEPHED